MSLIATRNDLAWKQSMEGVYVRIKDVAILPSSNQIIFYMEYYLDKESREQFKKSIQAKAVLQNGRTTQTDEEWNNLLVQARDIMPISQFNYGCAIDELTDTLTVDLFTDKNKLLEVSYNYLKKHFGFENNCIDA